MVGEKKKQCKYFGKLVNKYEKPFKNLKPKAICNVLDQLPHIFKS